MERVLIPLEIYRSMQKHAENTYPYECCGILVGSLNPPPHSIAILRIVPAENQAGERMRDRFTIDPLFYLKTEESLSPEETIVGFYHSHPDCPEIPSETDRTYALGWPGFLWIIHRVEQGIHASARSWMLAMDGSRFYELKMEFLT